MQLFERIRFLAQEKSIPQSKLAEIIGVYPQKFSQWLTEKSQKNIWEHLPTILENFPDVRPEWLYCEDGPISREAGSPLPNRIWSGSLTRLEPKSRLLRRNCARQTA